MYEDLINGWSSLILKNFGYFKNMIGLVQKQKSIMHVGTVNRLLREEVINGLQEKYKSLDFYSNEFIVEIIRDPYTGDLCETIAFPINDENFNKRYFVLNPVGKMFSIKYSNNEYDYDLMKKLKIDAKNISRYERTFEEHFIDLVPRDYQYVYLTMKKHYNTKLKKVNFNSPFGER